MTKEQFQEAIIAAAEAAISLRDEDPRAASMASRLARAWKRDMDKEFSEEA